MAGQKQHLPRRLHKKLHRNPFPSRFCRLNQRSKSFWRGLSSPYLGLARKSLPAVRLLRQQPQKSLSPDNLKRYPSWRLRTRTVF